MSSIQSSTGLTGSVASIAETPLTFQELLFCLQSFWAARGCVLQQPYDVEVGAGTMSPETFLRVLGPKPYRVGMRSLRDGLPMAATAKIRTGCSNIPSFS